MPRYRVECTEREFNRTLVCLIEGDGIGPIADRIRGAGFEADSILRCDRRSWGDVFRRRPAGAIACVGYAAVFIALVVQFIRTRSVSADEAPLYILFAGFMVAIALASAVRGARYRGIADVEPRRAVGDGPALRERLLSALIDNASGRSNWVYGILLAAMLSLIGLSLTSIFNTTDPAAIQASFLLAMSFSALGGLGSLAFADSPRFARAVPIRL